MTNDPRPGIFAMDHFHDYWVVVAGLEPSSVASSRAEPFFRRSEGSPRKLCLGRSLPRLKYAAVRD